MRPFPLKRHHVAVALVAPRRPFALVMPRRALTTAVAAPLSPKAAWLAKISTGELRRDENQEAALPLLERLHEELQSFERKELVAPGGGGGASRGFLSSLFGGGGADASASAAEPSLDGLAGVPRGVYLHGGVGCGKSMLMDTFYDCSPLPAGTAKRRLHFHEFMLDVHKRLHELRQQLGDVDPIPYIAHDISKDTQLLCFDEFQVRRCGHRAAIALTAAAAAHARPWREKAAAACTPRGLDCKAAAACTPRASIAKPRLHARREASIAKPRPHARREASIARVPPRRA